MNVERGKLRWMQLDDCGDELKRHVTSKFKARLDATKLYSLDIALVKKLVKLRVAQSESKKRR
jgi:hypothetical protein